jgi:hypothetical protein
MASTSTQGPSGGHTHARTSNVSCSPAAAASLPPASIGPPSRTSARLSPGCSSSVWRACAPNCGAGSQSTSWVYRGSSPGSRGSISGSSSNDGDSAAAWWRPPQQSHAPARSQRNTQPCTPRLCTSDTRRTHL